MTPFRILLLILLTVASGAKAMSSRPDLMISFHVQGSAETDSPKSRFQVQVQGQNMTFIKAPEFTHENILAFYPFKAPDGTNGVTLRLDGRGKRKLELVSQSAADNYMIALVNGKPVDLVLLDKPVLDGVITIWQGVPDAVIKVMAKKYRKITPGKSLASASDRMEMDADTRSERMQATADDGSDVAPKKGSKGKSQSQQKETPVLNLPGYNTDPAAAGAPQQQAPITTNRIPVEGASPSGAGMASPSLGGAPANSGPPGNYITQPMTTPNGVRYAPPPPAPRAPGE